MQGGTWVLPVAMFFREFSVLKLRRSVVAEWEFPMSLDECASSPLAGAFDEATLRAFDRRLSQFPFATRTHDGRRAWTIDAGKGHLDVWLTSDGSVFAEGITSLNLVYAFFLQLLEVSPALALEDRITGELHDRHSLLRLVRRDEEKLANRLSLELAQAFAAA